MEQNKTTTVMKTKVLKLGTGLVAALLATAGVMFITGCASEARAPRKSGFLSHYHHLTKVDDTTWRYVNTNRLALYNKFQLSSVSVLAKEFEDKPLTPEAQQKGAEYVRQAVTKALGDRYPIVSTPGVDVGDLRLAITDVYKTGNRVGLTVEGEINDSYSTYQAAAVMRTELGEAYMGSWWDAPSAKQIIDAWAARLRQAIDDAHGVNLTSR